MTRVILTCALASLLLACGDDDSESDPIAGTYQTTLHTLAPGCEAAAPVEGECEACGLADDHFKLRLFTFFGQTGLVYVKCSADGSCEDDDDPDELHFNLGGPAFEGKKNGAWVGTARVAGGGGTSCGYGETEYRAETTETGVKLTLTERSVTYDEVPARVACKEGQDPFEDDCGCTNLIDDPPPASELTCDAIEVREAVAK